MVFLFLFERLQTSTITTYLAGLQHQLTLIDSPFSVWSPSVHQVLKCYQREEAIHLPQRQKVKLPFTREMILFAFNHILRHLPDPIYAIALHAAMCMGLMFLFRKSEYLTSKDGRPKLLNGRPITLMASDVVFWFGTTPYPATMGFRLPLTNPDMVSMYLAFSKSDQFGKGATRFFPAETHNPNCMVRVLYLYCRIAELRQTDTMFNGPRVHVHSAAVSALLKSSAILMGLDHTKVAMHSLRIGGLVTLFAADVPDHLKQLAGRWKSPSSFITYARATMQQFASIASALNNPQLVTAEHIKMFYQNKRG